MDVWDGTSNSRSAGSQRAPDRVDWDENVAQVAAAQTAVNVNAASIVSTEADILTNAGDISTNVTGIANALDGIDSVTLQSVGAVETVSGLAVAEYGDGATHKTVLTLTSMVLTTVDGTTPATDGAWAALKLYVFPLGSKISTLCHFKVDLANVAGDDGLTDTADFDLGLGSVAVAQASAFSLSGTQSDYGETVVALVAAASTDDTNTQTTLTNLTTRDLYLNLRTVDDADHGVAAGSIEVTGTIVITWTMIE